MASRLTQREERAEAAARTAANELSRVNRERKESNVSVVGQTEQTPSEQSHQTGGVHEESQPGIIGSLIKTVQGTLGQAKDTVTGKSRDAAEMTRDSSESADYTVEKAKAAEDTTAAKTAENAKTAKDTTAGKLGEYKDYTAEKAKEANDYAAKKAAETRDYAADKAKQAKDTTMEKAGEYKDYTAEKAKQGKDTTVEKGDEYKDYTAGKAVEGKDTTVGKMTELKDSAADAARRAMDYLTGKRDETKTQAVETGETVKQKTGETMGAAQEKYEDAKTKMEELKIEGEKSEAAAERGSDEEARGGGGGIFGIVGAIKDKLTPQPTEKMDEQGTRVSHGGTGEEAKAGHKRAVDEEGVPVVVKMEGTTVEAVAAALKEADQMTGQTFNDVRPMGDEGVTRVRVDRTGKM